MNTKAISYQTEEISWANYIMLLVSRGYKLFYEHAECRKMALVGSVGYFCRDHQVRVLPRNRD